MDFDINTPAGMEQAQKWLTGFFQMMREGAIWGIPRSNSAYQIYQGEKRVIRLMGCDAPTERVLKAAGYTVVEMKEDMS